MKHTLGKAFILFALSALTLHAEMKCESGKCSSGKESSQKMTTLNKNTTATEEKREEKTKKSISSKRKEKTNKHTIEQLFNVTTVRVKEQKTAKEQVNYGYITVEDSRRVEVSSWYSGFVEALYADTLYKQVKKGEALVKVYSPEVYKAKQDYLNSLKFNAQHASAGMLRGAKEKLRLLNVNEKEINLIETTRSVNEYTTIYAPISGWIFQKNLNKGSSFKKQEKLFEIVNLKEVWLEVKLFQKQLKNVEKLENYSVKVQGITTEFKAKKSLLYPMLNPKEATATLRLTINNDKEILKPGMYAKVHATASIKSRLLIPRTAALRKNGKWYAFLATEFKGEYEPIQIDLEPLDKLHFIVKKGLSKGEVIVNNALFMMDSDAQINSIY